MAEQGPDMVQVTFEIPDHLLGDFYIAVGATLNRAKPDTEDEPASPVDWGTAPSELEFEPAREVWRKFSPRAQAVFSLLIDNPGIAMTVLHGLAQHSVREVAAHDRGAWERASDAPCQETGPASQVEQSTGFMVAEHSHDGIMDGTVREPLDEPQVVEGRPGVEEPPLGSWRGRSGGHRDL